jgi:CheY-like chemotaxis protein
MELKRKVLILDDSELTLGAAAIALERGGYEVRTATSIAGAESILAEWLPDLVLTDVNMPGVDEHEICLRIKSSMREQPIPVLLYSGLPEDELEPIALRAGADGFLTKAKGLRHLVSELRAFCGGAPS